MRWLVCGMLSLSLGLVACGDESTPTQPGEPDVTSTPPDDIGSVPTPDIPTPPDTVPEPMPDIIDTGDGETTDAADAPDVSGPEEPQGPNWVTKSLGDVGRLTAMSPGHEGVVFAVGDTRVIRYAQGYWASYGDPGEADLLGVWASETEVVVVGRSGFAARRAFSDIGWTVESTGTTADLYAVSGNDAGHLWAVGDDMTIVHFDGEQWQATHSGTATDLRAVWLPSDGEEQHVRAVGTRGQLVRKVGDNWIPEQIAGGSVVLYDIWGYGDMELAVGSGSTIAIKRNATAVWQGQVSGDDAGRDLHAIVGISDENIYALGAQGAVLHYTKKSSGTLSWSKELVLGPYYVNSDMVAASRVPGALDGPSEIIAVAAQGGGLRLRDDDAWVDQPTIIPHTITSIVGTDETQLWAVGHDGLVLTNRGGSWSIVPTDIDEDLHSAALDDSDALWLVGSEGAIFQHTAERPFDRVILDVPVNLNDVLVTDDGVLVCGTGGTLMHIDSEEIVTTLPSGSSSELRAMVTGGDGSLWIAGAFGTLLRGEGDEIPSLVSSSVSGSLNALAATADGVLVAGDGGVILHATADGATLLHESPGLFLYGIAASDNGSFAIGRGASVETTSGWWEGPIVSGQDEGYVTEPVNTNKAILEAIWYDGSTVIAVGRQGVFVERQEAP